MTTSSRVETRQRILFLSHSHAFRSFRVGSHHYARELAHHGADVVHLSTPISRFHRILGRVSREEESAVPRGSHTDVDGVTHLVPRTTLPVPYGRFTVKSELMRNGISVRFDAVLIDQPLLWDNTVRTLAPRLVYRPTDLYPSGVKSRIQQRIAVFADGVIATSEEVLRSLGNLTKPTLVLGNGVDVSHFVRSIQEAESTHPVCVYVGALDQRFDWTQVDAWARAFRGVRFVVAGPAPRPPAGLPRNVELVGAVPYASLPELLGGARVGVLPLSDDPLNAGRSPMKLYEYLAAGLSVVSRRTPAISTDEAAGIFTYSKADANDALRRALAHAAPNFAGVYRAHGETWKAKASQLLAFLEGFPDTR